LAYDRGFATGPHSPTAEAARVCEEAWCPQEAPRTDGDMAAAGARTGADAKRAAQRR